MEFYLNQKSLPMIRKCSNCRFYHSEFNSCSLIKVTNAYDHEKNIFLTTGPNLYCDRHNFKNEDTLREEAIVVEYESVEKAMEVIKKSKAVKDVRRGAFDTEE